MAGTVLIVDDSEGVRNYVREVLAARNMFSEFIIAGDGVDGFKRLVDHHVDLVLCDLVMPGFDGYKFLSLKESRPEYSEIPVIMLTGAEDVKAKVKALEAGASDYLIKPFHDEELVARVRVHLKIKALQDELREKNARLEELSRTDGLTKLANRRFFMEVYYNEFKRAERYQHPIAYIMADIDHFKSLNDRFGHQAGDRALATVASILRNGLREHDVIGRYGGEEFAMFLPHTDREGAASVAERMRRQVQRESFVFSSTNVTVTVSLGVSSFPLSGVRTADELIQAADTALYSAKDKGRNRVELL